MIPDAVLEINVKPLKTRYFLVVNTTMSKGVFGSHLPICC